MATTREATRTRVLARARWLGADAALAAASWVTMPASDAESVLTDVDPLVLDRYPEPNLSGEFADDLTPDLLAIEVGLTLDGATVGPEGTELVDAIADAWEDGRDLVWSDALQAIALRILGRIDRALTVEQTNERTIARLHRACEHGAAA
jgi:hypothetical protein